ncbi:hypothetical protein B1C81_24325 [Streptomyces sp. HG99]|nr:hypothetical protein B1C81_24325 [Streptomyces sp. HG99]
MSDSASNTASDAADSGGIGLRERKKQRMYQAVSDIAIGLFLEKGFDAVSVAEISKPTVSED